MFQQCVRWKQVVLLCILSSATITKMKVRGLPTTPACPANEFILDTGCARCHCRPDCPCDLMKGCTGSQDKCGGRCAVGYAGIPSCQFEMKTPGIDSVTWISEAPNTVKFLVNRKPDLIPPASGWYSIRCVSSLPPHSIAADIRLNNTDGISLTDMTSASYYCYIALRYGHDESLEGPAVAVTPCTAWNLPTKNDLIITTYFEMRGKHRIVLNAKFPKLTDCYDDRLLIPPTYDVAVRTQTKEVVFWKSASEPSDFEEIVDERMELSADTTYTLTLRIYDGGLVGEVTEEFATTSFTPPYVLTSSSNYSQPKPHNVVISFPVWNWTDNKGNVAPDSYTVRYRELNGTAVVAEAREDTTITGDVVSADITIRHPGLTLWYVIECTVTSYDRQYTTPSPDSRSFQTQTCGRPSPFRITGAEFSRRSSLAVELEVSFSESAPRCEGRATYELLSSREGVSRTTTCSAWSCRAAQVLEGCSKYNITVIASNQASLSTSSNTEEVTTPVKVPSEPSNLRFDVKEKPMVKVFWHPPTATNCPVQGYKISVLNTDTTAHLYDEKNVGLNLSFTFTGEFYTEYEVTVRPVNEKGDGSIARRTIKVPPTTTSDILKPSAAAIASGAVGGVTVAIAIVIAIFVVRYQRQRKESDKLKQGTESMANPAEHESLCSEHTYTALQLTGFDNQQKQSGRVELNLVQNPVQSSFTVAVNAHNGDAANSIVGYTPVASDDTIENMEDDGYEHSYAYISCPQLNLADGDTIKAGNSCDDLSDKDIDIDTYAYESVIVLVEDDNQLS